MILVAGICGRGSRRRSSARTRASIDAVEARAAAGRSRVEGVRHRTRSSVGADWSGLRWRASEEKGSSVRADGEPEEDEEAVRELNCFEIACLAARVSTSIGTRPWEDGCEAPSQRKEIFPLARGP